MQAVVVLARLPELLAMFGNNPLVDAPHQPSRWSAFLDGQVNCKAQNRAKSTTQPSVSIPIQNKALQSSRGAQAQTEQQCSTLYAAHPPWQQQQQHAVHQAQQPGPCFNSCEQPHEQGQINQQACTVALQQFYGASSTQGNASARRVARSIQTTTSTCKSAMQTVQHHDGQKQQQQQQQQQTWKELQPQQQQLWLAHTGQHWQQRTAALQHTGAAGSWGSSDPAGSGQQPHLQLQQQQQVVVTPQQHDMFAVDNELWGDNEDADDGEVCDAPAACTARHAPAVGSRGEIAAAAGDTQWPVTTWPTQIQHQDSSTAATIGDAGPTPQYRLGLTNSPSSMQWALKAQRHANSTQLGFWATVELTEPNPTAQDSQQDTDSVSRLDQHRDCKQQLRQQPLPTDQFDWQEFNAGTGHEQQQHHQASQQWQPKQMLWQQQQQPQQPNTPWSGQQWRQQQQQPGAERPSPVLSSRWANSKLPSYSSRVARPPAPAAAAGGSTTSVQGNSSAGKARIAAVRQQGKRQHASGNQQSSLERKFVSGVCGSPPSKCALVQASLETILRRAQRNRHTGQPERQRERQPVGGSDPGCGFLAGSGNSMGARKPMAAATAAATVATAGTEGNNARTSMPAAPKVMHKRKSIPAAAAAAAPAVNGDDISAASRSYQPVSSGGSKKRRRSGKVTALLATQQAVHELTEVLDMDVLSAYCHSKSTCNNVSASNFQDLSNAAAWQQLQHEVAVADAVALGLLLCQRAGQAVQYYTSLQPITKQQLQSLKKAARATNKLAAAVSETAKGDSTAAVAAGNAEDDGKAASGELDVVGLAVMPAAASCRRVMYYLTIPGLAQQQQQHQQISTTQQQLPLPPAVLTLLSQLLQSPDNRCRLICSNAKMVLCCLSGLGLQLPCSGAVALLDPEILAWLADPQLVQDTKQDSSKPADCYSLHATLERYALQGPISRGAQGPLQRLHEQLQCSISLADMLLVKLKGHIADSAITTEMKVAAILVKMEMLGVGVDPSHLLRHRAALLQRTGAISARAAELAGGPFNLASASQLSRILYEVLGLVPPTVAGGRGSAKTHFPTDESALKRLELSSGHELPGLAIEYRSKMNALSKYFDAPWVQRALKQAQLSSVAATASPSSNSRTDGAAQSVVDLRCCWNQTNTATGRLSSCSPNLQAVTKYTISSDEQQQRRQQLLVPTAAAATFSIRDVFVARPGYILLSADYSQVELRLLAHFSGDQLLQQLLSQSGPKGDVFSLIAAAWQQPGGRLLDAGGHVDQAMRERAKRVTYGICYGVGAYRLSQQLQDQGITVEQAQALIDSFLHTFSGVQRYMAACLARARAQGYVSTLLQRVRPIADLHSPSFQDRSAAERKVVNSIIQGSAADIIKLAMCKWDAWVESPAGRRTQPAGNSAVAEAIFSPCARLIGQIHDELLFEVAADDCVLGPNGEVMQLGSTLQHVAGVVNSLMQGAAQLDVGLHVRLSYGSKWGSMQALETSSNV